MEEEVQESEPIRKKGNQEERIQGTKRMDKSRGKGPGVGWRGGKAWKRRRTGGLRGLDQLSERGGTRNGGGRIRQEIDQPQNNQSGKKRQGASQDEGTATEGWNFQQPISRFGGRARRVTRAVPAGWWLVA